MQIDFPLSLYENIIFDIGNVVLDWNPDEILKNAWGVSTNFQYYIDKTFGSPEWLQFDKGEIQLDKLCLIFSTRLGKSVEEMRRLLEVAKESLVPFPKSLELLDSFQEAGFNLYALTNMPDYTFSYLFNKYEFWKKFKHITVSSHVKMIKPDLAVYEYMLNKNSLDPTKTIFLDDSFKNVQAANELGMLGVHFFDAENCIEQLRAYSTANNFPCAGESTQ